MKSMRSLMEAVRVLSKEDELEHCLEQLSRHILLNEQVDLVECHRILVANGYREPVTTTTFYRALVHSILPHDRQKFRTVQDLVDDYTKRPNAGFRKFGAQSFAATKEGLINFINGLMFLAFDYDSTADEHAPSTLLADLTQIVMVYEVTAPHDAILFSMRGLVEFLKRIPNTLAAARLNDALHSPVEGYVDDDEVVIDASRITIVRVSCLNTADDTF